MKTKANFKTLVLSLAISIPLAIGAAMVIKWVCACYQRSEDRGYQEWRQQTEVTYRAWCKFYGQTNVTLEEWWQLRRNNLLYPTPENPNR